MRSIDLDPNAVEDLQWLIQNDRKLAVRTLKLIREVANTPFEGTGKPEPLKHDFAGAWSRRINDEHRLVYGRRGDANPRARLPLPLRAVTSRSTNAKLGAPTHS